MEFKDLRVKNIGAVLYHNTKNAKWKEDRRKYSTLQIKIKGKAIHDFGDRKIVATDNCIYFLNQYEDNEVQTFACDTDVSSIAVSFTTYEPIETPSFCIKLNNITECVNLFNKMKTQRALSDRGDAMALSYFYRLCAIFEEHRQKEYSPRDPRMITAKEYIDLHFEQKDCLDRSADESKISRRRFNELFKKQFGTTPNKYLTTKRIENAIILLTEHKISISEISDMCGFGDVYYFSKVFKAETGYTPGKYKKIYN